MALKASPSTSLSLAYKAMTAGPTQVSLTVNITIHRRERRAGTPVNDSYTTPGRHDLERGRDRRVANDSDVDGDALSAILVSQPRTAA